ncbi:MAG: hypothetical protein JRG91_10865, partial [Deltaproteobacteria bacterium]|nr:hypothetical protein [Deltaproteobacteria bacterium]
MRKTFVSTMMVALLGLAVLAVAPEAKAQGTQVKPYLLFVFDTSGSMVRSTSGAATNGDGSWDPWGSRWCCPGDDLDGDTIWNDSRMWISKEAIRKMVAATGDITFGLMKFPQRFSPASNLGGVLYRYNQTPSGTDQLCYSGWTTTGGSYCSSSNINEFLSVPFASESSDDVYEWVNHTEYVGGVHVEHELRGNGTTPLAWTIGQAGDYFEGSGLFGSVRVLPVDAYRGCRPYYAVVLADGDNTSTCGSNPVTEVANLWTLRPGVDPACTVHADCPGDYPTSPWGARCVAGQCQYHVYTYVIGMAYSSTSLNQMADAGDDGLVNGTATAFRADSEAGLSAILSSIVRDSVLIEICNDLDDNCNGLVDEGFTKYCDLHDVHGGGATSSLIYCLDPGETVCDYLDDNCDGSVDEGLLNLCGTCGTLTEVCDGVDNDCDTLVDEGGVCSGC